MADSPECDAPVDGRVRRLRGVFAKPAATIVLTALLCAAVGVCLALWYASHKVRISSAEAERWMERQIPEMLAFAPDATSPVLVVEKSDERFITFRFPGTHLDGVLRFAGGEWVYVRAFSTHGLGSLILAVDSQGHLYACNGHVCPYLLLQCARPTVPADLNLAGFLASRVPLDFGESGSETWQRVDSWRAKAGTR